MITDKAIIRIPLSEILSDDEFNCRGFITPASVQDLVDNIQRLGLLSPIIVQKWDKSPGHKWRIICGHRRFLAMSILNKRGVKDADAIDCIAHNHLKDSQAYILNLSENVKRENLNIMQEALALKRFLGFGWTQESIAHELKVLRPWVQVRLALLRLPEEIQKRAAADMLTQHQIMEMSSLPTKDEQLAACRAAIDWKLQGNRGSLKLKKKVEKKTLKERNVFETGVARDRIDIGKMQEAIQAVLGDDHISARTLGWAAGFVSSYDFAKDIEALASAKGKTFKLPGEEPDEVE
jgi:ParB family chromosome partitioning protein